MNSQKPEFVPTNKKQNNQRRFPKRKSPFLIAIRLPRIRLPPGGRDALRKYAGGIFLAKAGSKLCLRPGPKAVSEAD